MIDELNVSMLPDSVKSLIADLKIHLDDPDFFLRVFSLVSASRNTTQPKESALLAVLSEEYNSLSIRTDMSGIQNSCSIRNTLRTRKLAELLIDEEGALNAPLLKQAIETMEQNICSIGPNRQYDIKRNQQILSALKLLRDSKETVKTFNKIAKPYSHRRAEEIIKETLQLSLHTTVTDAHAKRAVLAAWMATLRQSVGSCFATAPAIIIHDEQPHLFLADISELLATGRLKRTFGGVEYAVPFSVSWGAGDLKRPFILSLGEAFQQSNLWLSPGFSAAFEAAELISSKISPKEQTNETKAILEKFIKSVPKNMGEVTIIAPEEIIKQILLQHLGITKKDLQDYHQRPRDMIQSSLMAHVASAAKGSGGKGEACSRYYFLLEQAFLAFKSLADNPLLKTWEFTLASFAETKNQFARYNLYASLGFGPEQPGGIGKCIYDHLKDKLEDVNRKLHDTQYEYEQLFAQLKYIEGRVRSASESEIKYLKAEYQSRLHEFRIMEEMRDGLAYRGRVYSNLFDKMLDLYDSLFPDYFQEVYDADMHDVRSGIYDDSPAGFRLLYKHGRTNTSLWTPVRDQYEYIEALVSFFTATENEILSTVKEDDIESEVSEIITAIVIHVKTKEFLETALNRMAIAHKQPPLKDPLDHLDKIEAKPWAYISGGTMGTLTSCYWKRDQNPTEISRWIENPMELLLFLIDTLKELPPKVLDEAMKNPEKGWLMHSPTHAFLLKPGNELFRKAWTNETFTYTYVRDYLVKPMELFIDFTMLDEQMMGFLIEKLSLKVHENFRHYFKKTFVHFSHSMNAPDFRNTLIDTMRGLIGLKTGGRPVLSPEEIDSALYSMLPLCPADEMRNRIQQILKKIESIDEHTRDIIDEMLEEIPRTFGGEPYVTAKCLQDTAKGLLCLAWQKTSFPIDYHWHISQAAQELRYALPTPIIFADTNWTKEEFAFLISPGTGKLELWRVDYTGSVGFPMSQWEPWLDGSRRDREWGIYTHPHEYSS